MKLGDLIKEKENLEYKLSVINRALNGEEADIQGLDLTPWHYAILWQLTVMAVIVIGPLWNTLKKN